jgi:hypothetical protein
MTELVGREREEALLASALAAGRNVVLSGKYGSGRTALVRHVAETAVGRFRFAFCDFSAPPRETWAVLAAELVPERRRKAPSRQSSSRALRARVLGAPLAEGPPPVVVLDDVGRLTPARLDVVRRLAVTGCFRFVAIVEAHLPGAQRAHLLACLAPLERLRLGPLTQPAVREFLARAAAARGLDWTPEKVEAVARGTAGHPLSMRLALDREQAREPPR